MRTNVVLLMSALFGIACLVDNAAGQDEVVAEIQATSTPPTIDGLGDDPAWANATVHGNDEFFVVGGELGFDSGFDEIDPDDDLSVSWKGLWDNDNLYVLVEVHDADEIINEDSCNWNDDGIELYIDAQNLDVEDFRPTNNPEIPAYQLTVIAADSIEGFCGENRIPEDSTSVFTWGINSYDAGDPLEPEDDETQYPQGADTSKTVLTGEDSYSFEVAFPWEALEETPANIIARGEFGFGIAVNDDDDEGDRDTQVMWATEAADLWMRSDTFPSVALIGDPTGLVGDFNSNKELDAGDLDLLSQGMKDNDLAFDLNQDGVTNIDDRFVWVDDLKGTYMGDSNLDLEFNSSDLVAVFAAGKYENGEMAGWAQGDWNGDMSFSSSDLVTAFTAGGYNAGQRPAGQAVPEPASLTMILFGLSIVGIRVLRQQRSA